MHKHRNTFNLCKKSQVGVRHMTVFSPHMILHGVHHSRFIDEEAVAWRGGSQTGHPGLLGCPNLSFLTCKMKIRPLSTLPGAGALATQTPFWLLSLS